MLTAGLTILLQLCLHVQQDLRTRPEDLDTRHSSRAERGRADLEEPRRSRDALDDRRRLREDDRRRVKEEAVYRAPEPVPETQVIP